MINQSISMLQKSDSSLTLGTLFSKGVFHSARTSAQSTRKSSMVDTNQLSKRTNDLTLQEHLSQKLSVNLNELESQILESTRTPSTLKESFRHAKPVQKYQTAVKDTVSSIRQNSVTHRPLQISIHSSKTPKNSGSLSEIPVFDTLPQTMSCRSIKVLNSGNVSRDFNLKLGEKDPKEKKHIEALERDFHSYMKQAEKRQVTVSFHDTKDSLTNIDNLKMKKRVSDIDNVSKPKVLSEKEKKKRILSAIKVPTKYPDLEERIKEFIVDSSFYEFKEDRKSVDDHHLKHKSEFQIMAYDEKLTANENLDKAGMIRDVYSKEKFNQWFDEVVVKTYLERIDKVAEFLHLGPSEDSPLKKTQPLSFVGNIETKTQLIQEKALSFLKEFPTLVRNEQGGTTHICYHPNSFPEEFHRYIEDAKELLTETKTNSEVQTLKFLEVIRKALQNKKKLHSKSLNRSLLDTRPRSARRSSSMPDVLLELQTIKDGLEKKFFPIYSKCKWNKGFEKEFQNERLDSILSTNVCTLRLLNKNSMLNFLRKSPAINLQKDRIEQEEISKKSNYPQLNINISNWKKIQNKINNMDPKVIEAIEYQVANDILCKFENDVEYISRGRTRYLSQQNMKKSKLIKQIDKENKMKKLQEEEQKDIELRFKQAAMALNRPKKHAPPQSPKKSQVEPSKNIPMTTGVKDSIKFSGNPVLRSTPRVRSPRTPRSPRFEGLAGILEEIRSRKYRLVSAAEEIKDKAQLRGKLKRVYSGGPRGDTGRPKSKTVEIFQKAVFKLQKGIVTNK